MADAKVPERARRAQVRADFRAFLEHQTPENWARFSQIAPADLKRAGHAPSWKRP